MMRLPPSIAMLACGAMLALATSACATMPAWPLLAQAANSNETIVSPPGEDGTRYLSVEAGPLASPRRLRSRWNATARRVCEGDYQPLSETAAARRASGIVRARIHEGYFQCVLPGEEEPGTPGAPTADDAMASDKAAAPKRGGAAPRLGRR